MGTEKVAKITWTPSANFDVYLLFFLNNFELFDFMYSQVKHVEQRLMSQQKVMLYEYGVLF
jgi:hypothetical protein